MLKSRGVTSGLYTVRYEEKTYNNKKQKIEGTFGQS
jgi:hypothetical protein